MDDIVTITASFLLANSSPAVLPSLSANERAFYRIAVGYTDLDGDAIYDSVERMSFPEGTGTNPYLKDSDQDRFLDGYEFLRGADPLDPDDTPDDQTIPIEDSEEGGDDWENGPINLFGNLKVTLVTFNEGHHLSSDNRLNPYVAHHYQNGITNWPMSYHGGEKMALEAKMKIVPAIDGLTVTIVGSDGVVFDERPLVRDDPNSNIYRLDPHTSTNGISDSIAVYDGEAPMVGEEQPDPPRKYSPYLLYWIIKGATGDILATDVTKHSIYVTHGKPHVGRNGRLIVEESVFYIACDNAVGMSASKGNSILEMGQKIYDRFETLEVRKVEPTKVLEESGTFEILVGDKTFVNQKVLAYYADLDGDGKGDVGPCRATSTQSLLSDAQRNGQCGGWTWLFSDTLRVHRFNTEIVKVRPLSVDEDRFIVNNADILTKLKDLPNVEYPYRYLLDVNQFGDESLGIVGQGYLRGVVPFDPWKLFNDHFIVKFRGGLFDPAYGALPIFSNAGDEKDIYEKYEDRSVGFLGNLNVSRGAVYRMNKVGKKRSYLRGD